MEDDQKFLEDLIKALVNHPDDVKVDRKVDEMGVLLTLKVNQEDMGQIIGKSGATARAIRSLLRIVGLKNNARVNLKIEEPEGSTRGQAAPVAPSADGESEEAAPAEPAKEDTPDVDEAIGNLD